LVNIKKFDLKLFYCSKYIIKMYSYTGNDIQSLNNNRRWNNCINTKEIDNSNSNKKYKLYATGDADASGRKYIVIPSNTIITTKIKEKYNLF